jgi:hypothetical protein
MKMETPQNKTAVIVVVAAILAASITYFAMRSRNNISGPGTATTIEFKSDLVTLKIPVTQILVAEGERYKGSWFVAGWANLGVKMKDVSCVRKLDGKTVEYKIPEAEILDVAVDFERSIKWDIKRTAWYPNPFDGESEQIRDDWQKAAQILVREAANNAGLKNLARDQARQVVVEQIKQLGLEPVEATPPQQMQ